jgi:hypothetical protein
MKKTELRHWISVATTSVENFSIDSLNQILAIFDFTSPTLAWTMPMFFCIAPLISSSSVH